MDVKKKILLIICLYVLFCPEQHRLSSLPTYLHNIHFVL